MGRANPSGGEQVDELAHNVLKLAHEAIDRFPEMKRRHMFMAGGAAISSALIVGAGVAIMRRVRSGQTPADAVRDVTEEEIAGLHLVEREHYRPNGDGAGSDATGEAGAVAEAKVAEGISGVDSAAAPEGVAAS